MKLKFDSGLDYQIQAIQSVTGLLEGTLKENALRVVDLGKSDEGMFEELNEIVIGNHLALTNSQLHDNLAKIQVENRILKSKDLISPEDAYKFPNFSIEMETGTGKTYVYLRTIFELNKLYGLKKFIIVVPSVAIREGVTTSIRLMTEHFRNLYDNVAVDHFVYQSKELPKVRQFAINNEIQIMIINIQAFVKDIGEGSGNANKIYQDPDSMYGRRPIDYIQSVNPIVIIDEPQSVDNTNKSQKAINNLNPLFALRYSATHINPYNLIYQLGPVQAYDMKIVKQIEVIDTVGGDDFNQTMVRLDDVGYWPKTSKVPQAKVTIYEDTPNGPREKQIKVKHGADLSTLTNRKLEYEGFLLTNISAEAGNEYLEFQNGKIVELYHEDSGLADIKLKNQLRQTIEQHFSKEKRFKDKGIKVLSLFFIDHVHSYREYDEDGNKLPGKLATWFEEIYSEVSNLPMYKGIIPYTANQVHEGYFASDKKKGKVIEEFDTTGTTSRDDDAYKLIMQDKERLLTIDEPLRFIFSHSALREGWDNPNVFQICTLREMGTDRERRQTIGRGLRLPVDQSGMRIFDDQINRLTVIANESFESYARGLQTDIEKSIDPSGNFRFGRVPQLAFVSDTLDQDDSISIWNLIKKEGLIDEKGDFTSKFKPDTLFFNLKLPEPYDEQVPHVITQMQTYMPREFVKNARSRQNVTYQKRIESLNPEFKILWDKISKKTRYLVDFTTEELIKKSVARITNMPRIEAVKIEVTKRDVMLGKSGVESGRITSNRTFEVKTHQSLPDLIDYLSSDSEIGITGSTIFQILSRSNRLRDFVKNPAIFMNEVAKQIKKAKNELIIDGIKYEPILGEQYEMRLFEEKEIVEYMEHLYEVNSKDNRTPYDYIQYDSAIERSIAELLDNDERVKFYCKLPRWFKVATPLGEYNPDWAVVVEDEKKLYLVRETKGTLERGDRRESENFKIDCGKAHFESLGVNFKDVVGIHDLLRE